MKTLKCIISVIVGAGLGLISACCSHRATPASASAGTNGGPQTNVLSPSATNAAPAKQENLPVRKPTME